MQASDIFYIVAAMCLIFISVPLTIILWRTSKMMDRVEKLLTYVDHLRELAISIEEIPMKVIERLLKK